MKKNITDHLWTDKICSFFDEKGISYLFISRPKILTIFFSLINFITKNNVSYKYLITNVGFIDFTPRKKRTCDILSQSIDKDLDLSYSKLSRYKLNSGLVTNLYTFNYKRLGLKIQNF